MGLLEGKQEPLKLIFFNGPRCGEELKLRSREIPPQWNFTGRRADGLMFLIVYRYVSSHWDNASDYFDDLRPSWARYVYSHREGMLP